MAAFKPATFELGGKVADLMRSQSRTSRSAGYLNHGDLATPPAYAVLDLLHLAEKDYRAERLRGNLILLARRLAPNGSAA